jgi:hypothetical protein
VQKLSPHFAGVRGYAVADRGNINEGPGRKSCGEIEKYGRE